MTHLSSFKQTVDVILERVRGVELEHLGLGLVELVRLGGRLDAV